MQPDEVEKVVFTSPTPDFLKVSSYQPSRDYGVKVARLFMGTTNYSLDSEVPIMEEIQD